jgi:hypothetical protein
VISGVGTSAFADTTTSQAAQPPATLQPPPQLPSAETDIERRTGDLRRVQLQGTWLTYQLQRSKRRSIGFLINEDGLRITAPAGSHLPTLKKPFMKNKPGYCANWQSGAN